jgi:hypothetical protein
VAAALANGDRHFVSFAYTGGGAGGVEEPLYIDALAYSDDALLYLDSLPPVLTGLA